MTFVSKFHFVNFHLIQQFSTRKSTCKIYFCCCILLNIPSSVCVRWETRQRPGKGGGARGHIPVYNTYNTNHYCHNICIPKLCTVPFETTVVAYVQYLDLFDI
jgi:hypothetical protein